MRSGICCLVILCSAAPAIAQPAPESKHWDAAASIGWVGGDKGDFAEEWDDWYDTFAASVDVGCYWTPHLKTEIGGVFTTEGRVVSYDSVLPRPGDPFPIFITREHHFRLNGVTASAAYQFFENQWVHPFLAAGVQLGWEHERVFSPEQFFYGRDPRNPSVISSLVDDDRGWTFSARPFASGGAKFYVSERGFLRTDLTVAWYGGGVAQVGWRAGAGIDF
jgi:hypothetical protein